MGVVDRTQMSDKNYRDQQTNRLQEVMNECESAAKKTLSEWCNE